MKKIINPLFIVLPTILALTACNQHIPASSVPSSEEPSSEVPSEPSSSEGSYVERNIEVIDYDRQSKGTAACRFYDADELIPYLDLNSYYGFLLNKEVNIEPLGNDTYKVQTYSGEATINTATDVLYSDDYNQFINTTIYRSSDSRNGYYDGAPFLKVGEYTSNKEATPKTIDFKKYKIDFKYEDNKLWAPLITWSDMFKGVTMIQTFYNGDKIYLVDSNLTTFSSPIFIDESYLSHVGENFFKNGERNELLAELSYLEMCFTVDEYYGFPGRSPLENMINEHGLDYALDNYSDSSRLTKEYLTSTDINKYIAGTSFLADLLKDGGHTIMDQGTKMLMEYNTFSSYGDKDEVTNYLNNSGYEYLPPESIGDYYKYILARNEMTENARFIQKDDTFIYVFNSFNINFEAWNAFYKKETNELPNDTIGNFHRAIEMAKQNPNIKNFVMDISINGGGFGDVVMYLMGALTNNNSMYFYDHIDERYITQEYLCDINLDGKFDELDKQPISDFNYAIVTSEISFSCGNLFPALAQDEGIPLIGYNTGGGACAVLDSCSMEGIYYRLSSYLHLTDKNYNSIDAGIEVDYDIFNVDGEKHFNNLYDIDIISAKVNEFYDEN